MQSAVAYLIVFVGAGIGGALRHGVNVFSARVLTADLPAGTLVVNILGSLAIGSLAGVFALKVDPGQAWRLFLATGVLGGFTTFSAFSLEVVLLYERGEPGLAMLHVVATVVSSISATFLALSVVRAFE